MIRITPALASHAQSLLNFELENRAHFEQWIATRGDHFYNLNAVKSSLEQAEWSAHAGREYHYLAWTEDSIVGRITLRDVEREQYGKALLGYRFSARHGGKGYATQAVASVVANAGEQLQIRRVEAIVIADNLPSLAIMRKCGFHQFGHSHASVQRNGNWKDMLHFEKLLVPVSAEN